MPEELQSYAVTLVRSILGARDLRDDTLTDDQRVASLKRQAELLIELNLFLLEHYDASGYDSVSLALALRMQLVLYAKQR